MAKAPDLKSNGASRRVARAESSQDYRDGGTTASWYEGWQLTDSERSVYRERSKKSSEARRRADAGEGPPPIHEINEPRFDPKTLMPRCSPNGLRSLSLFSGGGGLDLGFELAGFDHVASYELLDFAGATLTENRPAWRVLCGDQGDVTVVDWKEYRNGVDIVHGGPPCQPFSAAGRQKGESDPRDMFPEFVRAVRELEPMGFVAENVPGLDATKFRDYLQTVVLRPLSVDYTIQVFRLSAAEFGVPQIRTRLFFVGFRSLDAAGRFSPPKPTHGWTHLKQPGSRQNLEAQPELIADADLGLSTCMGAREALGLPEIGFDALAPTLRSTLTGPRHTTSILSSVSAQRTWNQLEIWPNGVALSREKARRFVAKNKHFRLSVQDCAVLQGFPSDWEFSGPVYKALGQVGNSVAPPVAYQVAGAVASALSSSKA